MFSVSRGYKNNKFWKEKTHSLWKVFNILFRSIYMQGGDLKGVKYTITIERDIKRR